MLPYNYQIKTQQDLFIAWDKDLCEFAEPADYIKFCKLVEDPWNDGSMHIQALGRYTKLNYVGLDDKNGDHIFESFIVEAKYNQLGQKHVIVGVVEFEKGGFVITDADGTTSTLSAFESDELEIIGNIFENRDLLRKERK